MQVWFCGLCLKGPKCEADILYIIHTVAVASKDLWHDLEQVLDMVVGVVNLITKGPLQTRLTSVMPGNASFPVR